jgi:predicted nucleic acid-binding protein
LNICYLDASAWVKRYYQEAGTEAVQEFFVEGAVLACASLGVVEVLATLSRKCKARQISRSQFQQKQTEVSADWEQFVQVQLTGEVLEVALRLTVDFSLRGADAIHLASASILKQSLTDEDEFKLIASDNELLEAAQQTGMSIFNPVFD